MTSADTLVQELNTLTDFIKDAESQTRDMKEVTLGDLDLKVAELCEQAKTLSGAEATNIHEPMMNMINSLEELADALKYAKDQEEQENS